MMVFMALALSFLCGFCAAARIVVHENGWLVAVFFNEAVPRIVEPEGLEAQKGSFGRGSCLNIVC